MVEGSLLSLEFILLIPCAAEGYSEDSKDLALSADHSSGTLSIWRCLEIQGIVDALCTAPCTAFQHL